MLRLGTRPERPRMSAPPELIDSQRLVADRRDRQRNVLQIFAAAGRGDDDVGNAFAGLGLTGCVASAAGVSVSPVTCANAGVVAKCAGSCQRDERSL